MFNLGFTMEELMFPENYQSNFLFNINSDCLIDKLDEISSIYENQEQIIIDNDDDDDDDWFTIKQLNPDLSLNDKKMSSSNDQTIPLVNIYSDNCYFGQMKSMVELDGSITAVLLPNLSIKVARDTNNTLLSSSSSDVVPTDSNLSSRDQLLSNTMKTITEQQSNKSMMSKSISSLSFSTQSSTSLTSSSADDINPDFNEQTMRHYSTESIQKLSYHQKNYSNINENSSNFTANRRRRKRTIFTAADIEYLKEAFIQNPKPNQQDIAILSDQLGHDSYVIRVWFYNKRQAIKKRND